MRAQLYTLPYRQRRAIYRAVGAKDLAVPGSLAEKKDRTPKEDGMPDMMLRGGERGKTDKSGAVLDWYNTQR